MRNTIRSDSGQQDANAALAVGADVGGTFTDIVIAGVDGKVVTKKVLSTVRDYSDARKYADERRILGISVGPHIMSIRRRHLGDRVNTDSRQLAAMVGGHVRIAGVLEAIRTATTQRGGKMIFLTLDDEFGLFEVTIFPNVRKRTRAAFNYQGTYVVSGRVQEQYGTVTITADSVAFWRDETARVAS